MNLQLGGLHHVTAVTGNAAANVTFYTQILGMRLVKKTVNQDDVSAYHLFYADAAGNPGTELTFFDWPHTIPNLPGVGTVAATVFWVADLAALDWWQRRFSELGIAHAAIVERAGRLTLPFSDPEGQSLELVIPTSEEAGTTGGTAWERSPVPAEYQIRGLHAVRLTIAQNDPSARNLTGTLGFRKVGEYALGADTRGAARPVQIFQVGKGGLGSEVHLEARSDVRPGVVGIGGAHHVAFRTPNPTEHQAWHQRIVGARLGVSPVIDRFYFKSIYFREPGGILFEIATEGPGFATDEAADHLGERLALPPFLEPQRARIEAGLQPIDIAPALR